MIRRLRMTLPLSAFLVFPAALGLRAQASPSSDRLSLRARQEYLQGKYADAERDFRELTRRDPSNFVAQMYLGQSLFEQARFAEAVGPYEKARQLEGSGRKLTADQHHVLLDQLVICYGESGNLTKVHALLDEEIRKDPDYPLNYYNLACAYAEEGNKPKMLENLATAFQHKDHMIKGERMPDPRADDSFQKYVHDDDFVMLVKRLGFN